MKFELKSCLAVCLISVAAQASASQVPCPSPEVVAEYADRIDTVQALGWSFAVMTGTDIFASPFYDDQSGRYWRLAAEIGIEKGGFNAAYKQGSKLIASIDTNMNKYADEHEDDGHVYTCSYSRGTEDMHVVAFSAMDNQPVNLGFMKSLFRRT